MTCFFFLLIITVAAGLWPRENGLSLAKHRGCWGQEGKYESLGHLPPHVSQKRIWLIISDLKGACRGWQIKTEAKLVVGPPNTSTPKSAILTSKAHNLSI